MKLFSIHFLLFILILIGGCQSQDTLSFVGEGENWSAEVILHQVSGKEKEDIILQYKGGDTDSIESFNYSIDAPRWGIAEEGAMLNEAGVYVDEGKSLNDKNTPEFAELTITIEWGNDQSETFQITAAD